VVEKTDDILLAPALLSDPISRRSFRRCARMLANLTSIDAEAITRVRRDSEKRAATIAPKFRSDFLFCSSVLCDLRGQGWSFRVTPKAVLAAPPQVRLGADERKAQIRSGHLIERDAQLSSASSRAFVRDMERRRLHAGEWHSIFSLMREGSDLATELEKVGETQDPARQLDVLKTLIQPYIQVVVPGVFCKFTGLKLTDIWRYFRHTWTTTYNSTPGRKIWFLVRDAASKNHPVIGIGAFGSAIVQLSRRDRWIGWNPDVFIEKLESEPTSGWGKWIQASLAELIENVRCDDFLKQRILSKSDISTASEAAVKRLREVAAKERMIHRLYPARRAHKASSVDPSNDSGWALLSETHLFRSKRALALADLLDAKRHLKEAGFEPSAKGLLAVLTSRKGTQAIRAILRYMKAVRAGVDMMDITVCGAIAPYNHLLGGKLVSLLMASPDAVGAYNARYQGSPSLIASSVAGRVVRRKPQLVLLGTTSLFDVSVSQYNRIKVPAQTLGGREGEAIEFVRLGRTDGMGSFHFSRDTMQSAEILLAQAANGRQVNSIFGEGVNPKLRKVRSALDAVGLPAQSLLTHGSARIIYVVPLATNFREVLLGRERRARYIIPQTSEATAALIQYWQQRWLLRRITNPEAIDRVAADTLKYPLAHGARVKLPIVVEEAGPLFSA
jgi:hypothetical protein